MIIMAPCLSLQASLSLLVCSEHRRIFRPFQSNLADATAMKAIAYQTAGPLGRRDALVDITLETPVATGRDLLVEVRAVSVNPVDAKTRRPTSRPNREPGKCSAGTPSAGRRGGEPVTSFQAGDEVFYAGSLDPARRRCRISPRRRAHRWPEAEEPLRSPRRRRYRSPPSPPGRCCSIGSTSAPAPASPRALLIVGGAGGVGSIAIQLARGSPASP